MSTGTFSAQNTSSIIEPLLRFVMPSTTEEDLSLINGVTRKAAHITEYFILGILLFRAFRSGSKKLMTFRWAFYSFLIVVLYAAGDEFHQSFEATRSASIIDVGIDAVGGIFAQVVIMAKLARRQHQ